MATLSESLRTWLQGLKPRERALVAVAAALTGVTLIYLALVAPLSHAVTARQARIERKQTDLNWMRGMAGPLRQLQSMQRNVNNNESLVVVVDRSARQTGLAAALTGQSPNGEQGIRVRLENAAFDSLVLWIGQLQQQYGLEIESANVDHTAKPGIVNATVTLSRATK